MEDIQITRINSFLAQTGQDITTVPKNRLNQLKKVDSAIQERIDKYQGAKLQIKESKINVSIISEQTGISRKTFYNNEQLRNYVEQYITFGEETNNESEDIERHKKRIQELERQIQGFLSRDIEDENIRHENMTLTNEIINYKKLNKSLENKLEEIQKKFSEYKAKNPISTKVMELKPNK